MTKLKSESYWLIVQDDFATPADWVKAIRKEAIEAALEVAQADEAY